MAVGLSKQRAMNLLWFGAPLILSFGGLFMYFSYILHVVLRESIDPSTANIYIHQFGMHPIRLQKTSNLRIHLIDYAHHVYQDGKPIDQPMKDRS